MTSTQIIFERAVRHHIHDAFVSLVEKIDEFNIGAVLLYREKPHWWRKKEVDFTGAQLADLIGEDQRDDFTFNTESSVLFDETSDSSQRTVNIDLDLDGKMKVAIVDLGGDIGGSAKKIAKINVSLGAFNHVKSNMFDAVTSKQFKINADHPVIKEAIEKGRSLFVISSVYQSQKVEISVTREEDVAAKGEEDAGNEATGGSTEEATKGKAESKIEKVVDKVEVVASGEVVQGKEDAKAHAGSTTTGLTVTKREEPSNIAFVVMKIDISKQGLLAPQGKSGFPPYHKVHASFTDSFDHINQKKSAAEGSGATGKEEEPPKMEEKPVSANDGGDKKNDESKE